MEWHGKYGKVSSDQLKELLKSETPGLLIDLRSEADFAKEHIDGAVNLPFEDFDPAVVLSQFSARPIYLICTSGKKAAAAASELHNYGFFEINIVAGGILAWRVLGFPLQKD